MIMNHQLVYQDIWFLLLLYDHLLLILMYNFVFYYRYILTKIQFWCCLNLSNLQRL